MNGATDRACAAAARVRKTVRATRRYASLTTASCGGVAWPTLWRYTSVKRRASDASAPSRRSRGFSARTTSLPSSRSALSRMRASRRPVSRIGSSRTASPCAAKPAVTAGIVASRSTVCPCPARPRAMLARLVPEPRHVRADVSSDTRTAPSAHLRLHRADVGGVEQRLLELVSIPGVGLPQLGRHEENRGTEAVLAQQRERDGAVRAVAVVEGDDDGARGQEALAPAVGEVVGERDARVAPPRQKRELRLELLGCHVVLRVA